MKKWNGEVDTAYGRRWKSGDSIGCLLDLEQRKIHFYQNGKDLGIAFKDIPVGENVCYFPGVSLQTGQMCLFNFGRRPFANRNIPPQAIGVDEPDARVQNYYTAAIHTLEIFKKYLIVYREFKHLDEDERLQVGSLVLEYLEPFTHDSFIMEEVICYFFQELQMLKEKDFVDITFKTFKVHFS